MPSEKIQDKVGINVPLDDASNETEVATVEFKQMYDNEYDVSIKGTKFKTYVLYFAIQHFN